MATRRGKIGLTHWPFDVDFYEDIKIRKLIKNQGGKAPQVYINLLGRIYKVRGYYLEWDNELPFIVSDQLGSGYDEGYVFEVIRACVAVGLFDEEMFQNGVLTSLAIQERYAEICSSLRRKCIIDKYDLSTPQLCLNVAKQQQNVAIKAPTAEDKHTIEKNRIEEKESSTNVEPKKEKDNSDSTSANLPEKPKNLEERKHEFGLSLVPYIEKYGKEMIRDFFDYWSEVSDGGNKMAWEKARTKKGTFNIAGRLATWKKNEDNGYGRRSSRRGSTISEAVQATVIHDDIGGQLDITKLLGQ